MRKTNDRLDLATYPPPRIEGQRSVVVRIAWMATNAILFQSALPLAPYRLKSALLRLFGARVGRGLVIKPSVNIKCPWFLEIGDHVWIGEGVWIDNPGTVKIGSHVCISQGAYLVTGNHNYKRATFDYFSMPIVIEDRVWVRARAILKPGAVVRAGEVVPLGGIWPADRVGISA